MDRKAFDVFDKVCAEDGLKKKTTNYLYAEIEKRRKGKSRKWQGFAAVFASIALFVLCGVFSWKIYFAPIAYIDIDVNPSIELTVNRFGRVIRCAAYNDDGTKILDEIDVCHENYGDALEKLLNVMGTEGYFEQDSLLCVTVQTGEGGREESMLSGLQEIVEAANRKYQYHIAADVYAVTEEIKHCAEENHISPAKYLAIQELLEVDPDADFEKCKEHSVHELQQLAKEKCREHGEHNGHGEESGFEEHNGSHRHDGQGAHP